MEDLYLPYKPKRRTPAMMAREKGLEPLAMCCGSSRNACPSLRRAGWRFVDAEKGAESPEQALAGAGDILAEGLSDTADVRAWLQEYLTRNAAYVATVTKAWGQEEQFEAYYDYRRALRDIAAACPSWRCGGGRRRRSCRSSWRRNPSLQWDYLAAI